MVNFFNNRSQKKALLPANPPLFNLAMSYQFPVDFLSEVLADHQTRIYIWDRSFCRGSVGHISIAFKHNGQENYISFWPERTPSKKFQPENGSWNTKEQDIEFENNRLPNFVIELLCLNTEKMNKKFLEIKEVAQKWNLLASTPLVNTFENKSFNCISVAIEVLRAGEIEQWAGEEIIKQQWEENDKGKYPYRHGPIDNSLKVACQCCGTCFKWTIYILAFLGILTAGIVKTGRDDPTLKKWDENPIFSYTVSILCGISALIRVYSICLDCKRLCCRTEDSEDNTSRSSSSSEHPSPYGIPTLRDIEDIDTLSHITGNMMQNALEIPYDTVRGLIEYTVVPDRRIKKILTMAKAKEEEQLTIVQRPSEKEEKEPAFNCNV